MPANHSDSHDYILDLSASPAGDSPTIENQKSKMGGDENQKSSYLSIYFKCCHVYAPIYRNRARTAYSGHCPRCNRLATIPISPTGSSARIFQAE
ncbi:MAG: hypothetical protein FWD61_11505 [Phycisphaerales bacterium]|nr:hypothetical protein [Phycisphaerales bacterium]